MARPIEKRGHIERSVVEVVARKGLHATTIQDIAIAAEVSPGLLYRYWENRDDLAGVVYQQHYNALADRLFAQATAATTSWERIEAVIREFLRFADSSPVILKFLLLSQHDLLQNIPSQRGVRRLVGMLIEDGQKTGAIRPMDPELALQFFLGVVLQPVVGFVYGTLPGPMEPRCAEILETLKRVLGKSTIQSQ